jgi:integral membrane protein
VPDRITPYALFRLAAVAEAITWTLLIIGMVLKYVTQTTDRAVSVFGLLHGIVFLAYVLVSLGLWVNNRWPTKVGVMALASSVPPYGTLWFERFAEQNHHLSGGWRLRDKTSAPQSTAERLLAWSLRRPVLAAVAAVVVIAATTSVLLWIGPPVPWARD